MKTLILVLCVHLWAAFASLPAQAQEHKWTFKSGGTYKGQASITANFISATKDTVLLFRKGKFLNLKLALLSQQSRAQVTKLKSQKPPRWTFKSGATLNGQASITANFISATKDTVLLFRNGKILNLKLALLSQQSRAQITKLKSPQSEPVKPKGNASQPPKGKKPAPPKGNASQPPKGKKPAPPKGNASQPSKGKKPAPPKKVKNALSSTDEFVGLLLGKKQTGYKVYGYNKIKLGEPFKITRTKYTLSKGRHACEFWAKKNPDSGFYFSGVQKLVIHRQQYHANPSNYIDQLVKKFGKTIQEIETREQGSSVVSLLQYHFPKVFVRVLLADSTRTGGGVHVTVADQKWLSSTLNRMAQLRNKRFIWMRSMADLLKKGSIPKKDIPLLENCVATQKKDAGKANHSQITHYFKTKGKSRYPIVAEAKHGQKWFGDLRRNAKFGTLMYDFDRNPSDAVYALANQKALADNPRVSHINPLAVTPLWDYAWKLNSLLAQHYFPPKTSKITKVMPSSGWIYYEWETKAGWTVTCTGDDKIYLTWRAKPKL